MSEVARENMCLGAYEHAEGGVVGAHRKFLYPIICYYQVVLVTSLCANERESHHS